LVTFSDIEQARRRIRDAIYVSPCAHSQTLSRMIGGTVFLKLENLQMTGSFKERGALNKMLTLSEDERRRGVVTASAGNHAQAVAFHAQRLGMSATVVMPQGTPLIKVSSTRGHGARVELWGATYDDAYARAREVERTEGLTFLHPFDDPLVIAGQGTVGLELLEQNPYLETVVLPVGGGGLASGVGVALKETNPRIRVVGVQAARVPGMKRSREAGSVQLLPPAQTIADGIAVRRVGDVTFPLVERYVDEIVTVDEEEIASAILLCLEREKTVVEGAGATPLAALLQKRVQVAGRKVCAVLSGGNVDPNVVARIIERGLVKDGRLVRLRVHVEDRPGALSRLIAQIAELGVNVLQIFHDRAFTKAAFGDVQVDLTLETRGFDHIEEIEGALRSKGFSLQDITH
jgi:threonine dehydratase